MEKLEQYRQILEGYMTLCRKESYRPSFRTYCQEHGVTADQLRHTLKDEFGSIKSLPGYISIDSLSVSIYEKFRDLCAAGTQPGTFTDYCRGFDITYRQVHDCLKRHGLRVTDLPGYIPLRNKGHRPYPEVPFEDVIFEESGFLPAESGNVITVRVDDRVAVTFPALTDISVVAMFVSKIGKEAGDVGA